MSTAPKFSSTLLLALALVLIGLGLINVFARQGRKGPPPAPAQPKPAPASTPKRPNHKTALANNSKFGKPTRDCFIGETRGSSRADVDVKFTLSLRN